MLINKENDRYTISKTGWFLLNDPATRVNIDFNHDVNYRGMFYLDEALKEGKPAGLKTLGDWPTIMKVCQSSISRYRIAGLALITSIVTTLLIRP